MDKIKNLINILIKKFMTKEVMLYGVFGVLTTIVNLAISYFLEGACHIDGAIASAVGILVAVLFAYFTNRRMVFNSTANNFKEKFQEFWKFMLGRAFTMILEEGGVIVFYNILNCPFVPVKLTFTIFVIILNFFISKFFAFKHKEN
jgi:putative flippase GtrA